MKNKYLIRIAAFCIAAFTFAGCGETIEEYITFDTITADFKAKDNQPIVVKVTANDNITVKGNDSWIKVTDVTANSFTVNVEDNTTNRYRTGTITVKCGTLASQVFTVYQTMADNEFCAFRKLRYMYNAMSPSGKYIGGYYSVATDDGSYAYQMEIIEVATDKITQFEPVKRSTVTFSSVAAMSDQGVLYISVENGGTIEFNINSLNSKYNTIQAPVEFKENVQVAQVDASGTKFVGWGSKAGFTEPILWENNEPQALIRPDKSFRGGPAHYGVQARGISADGSVIYGTSWEGYDTGLIWWKNGELKGYAGGTNVDNGDEIHFVSDIEEVIDVQKQFLTNGLRCQSEVYKVSHTGKYIGAIYQVEVTTPSGLAAGSYPAFFNTETNQTKVFSELGEGAGKIATEDGIGFTTAGILGAGDGYVVNISTGEILGKANEWIKEKYGIIPAVGYIEYCTADKTVLYGVSPEGSAMGVDYVNWYITPPISE